METIFNQQELQHINQQIWWVGCNDTPYLIKTGIFNQCILIAITNLEELWVTRIQKQKILKDKNIYAKTLQIDSFKQLLILFENLLINPQKKADYQFIKTKQNKLIFKLEKQIQVYPFLWKFQLRQVNGNLKNIICKQILNPLIISLNAQEKRINLLKRKLDNLQKQYIKKLSENQKNQYKSQIIQDQQDWKILLPQRKLQKLIDMRFDNSTKFFISSSLKQIQIQKQPQIINDKTRKVRKLLNNSIPQTDQLINQIEFKKNLQKQKQGPKKKIDFI